VRPRRPAFPSGYGLEQSDEGLLPWSWAAERLASARNYWIVTAGAPGPHAAPVWALWHDGAIVFSTDPSSRKARNLASDPRVVVHLESGDEVVIVEGQVEPYTAGREVVDAYERKYQFRPEPGPGWLAVRPARAYAWREKDFPKSATRFDR
jgi:general stress protein 26